jgi:hypothetical protein
MTSTRADAPILSDAGAVINLQRLGRFPENATYEHLRPHEEPPLWVADDVAWFHGAGADWSRRIETMVTMVREIEA